MASSISASDSLVSRFSYRPDCMTSGRFMIRVAEAAKSSTIDRNPETSTMGHGEMLPLEILHITLGQLDFRSISRFARTSLRANAVVRSLRPYQDMMRYAPHTLVALCRTDLVSFHSASKLHSALQSQACESCGEFGPFFFLPTCQRCCFTCLDRNQSFWVLPVSRARRYFGLTARQMAQIPVMRSLPGHYWVGRSRRTQRRFRLVSVSAVKTQAIRVHGSDGKLEELRQAAANAGTSIPELHTWRWYQAAPLKPLAKNPSLTPMPPNTPGDNYPGMASIQFSSFSVVTGIEQGIWCLGCRHLVDDYIEGRLARAILDSLPSDEHPRCVLEGMQNRSWTKAKFLRHLDECRGVRNYQYGNV